MTRDELEAKLQEILPGATLGVDNEGQVIVYTGKYYNVNDSHYGVLIERPEVIDV